MICILLLSETDEEDGEDDEIFNVISGFFMITVWLKVRSQINHFKLFIPYKKRRNMENSPSYDICNIDVHRAFYATQLRSKKQLENET